MPFQLSPGVAVVEKDFSSIVPAVSSSAGAIAGTFQWGPVLAPTAVSSENELVRQFGQPNDSTFNAFFTAANFLSYTNTAFICRADTANAKNAVSISSGFVTDITLTNAGSGYENVPTIQFSAPQISGGQFPVATCRLTGGSVTAIPVSLPGSGFTYATVTISLPDYPIGPNPGDGQQATATANISGGVLASIDIADPGAGYLTPPTITIVTDGTNYTLGTVTISTSSILDITLVSGGSGYTEAPSVTDVPNGTFFTNATISVSGFEEGGVKIKNSTDYLQNFSTGAGTYGQFAAKYPGTLGNSIYVGVADSAQYPTWDHKDDFDGAPDTSDFAASVSGTNDELHIIVIDQDGRWTGTPGAILEKFAFVSKASNARKADGTNNYYKDVINSRSQYIWWMDHPEGVTNWGTPAANTDFDDMEDYGDYQLSGAADDYNITDGDRMEAYGLFADDTQYDISLIPLGKASSTVANYVISNVAEVRKDCVVFVSPEDVDSGDIIIGNTSTEVNKIVAYRNALPSSSYAVMDTGYKYQYDRYHDAYRFIPLSGDIAGLCARTDYTNDPWFSPGGLNRGQIKNVVKLAVNPTRANRDTLYKAGVNPVVTFPGEGTVLYGDKTLLAKPSAFDRINVRRLFIVLEKAIATAAKFQLFEFNDDFTRAQFKNLVEPFLRDVQGRRGITDFVVKCDSSNNTGEIIDRNEFVADIFVKPNRSINFITLTFVAARSSINFTEIGA